jgi:hypothetical protein
MRYLRALRPRPTQLLFGLVVSSIASLLLPVAAGARTGSQARVAPAVTEAQVPAATRTPSRVAPARQRAATRSSRRGTQPGRPAAQALPSGLDLLLGRSAGSGPLIPRASITCVAPGGNRSSPGTWSGGIVPTAADDVTITNGCTVTVDTAAAALNVTVGRC